MRKPVLTIALSSFSLFAFSQDELMIHSNLTKKIDVTDVHHYKIKTVKGDFYKLLVIQNGIDLIIEVKPGDSSEARSFDSPNGSSGPEPVEFIASVTGNTFIDVKPFVDSSNTKAGEYSIEYVEHVSAAEYSKMLKQKQKDEDDFVSWIQKTSVPLKSVKAGSGFDDLESLKPVLANKRVVAMGEATHGTKEFFQMKHRMLEFLVKEMGFTVFAIEASYSRCRYINDYVLNGKGDLDTATTIHGFTTWSTEEVRDMIKWMRDYNSTNPARKIQFVGFDLQVNDAAAFQIIQFYEKVDTVKKNVIISLLRQILEQENKGGIFSGDTTIRNLLDPMNKMISDLLANKEEYIQKTSKEQFGEVLRDHNILRQYIISYSYNNFTETIKREDRDFFMAQNILAWLKYFPKGTKMMVWAHNGHVAKDYLDGVSVPSMGSYLKKELKDEYYVIGFDFYKGKFQSNDVDMKNSPGWEEEEVGEAPKENLSSFFVRAGLGNSFLDLTLTKKDKNVESWLNEKEIGTYSMGSQFSKKWAPSSYIEPMKLFHAFDGVIFIKESNRAVPIKMAAIDYYAF